MTRHPRFVSHYTNRFTSTPTIWLEPDISTPACLAPRHPWHRTSPPQCIPPILGLRVKQATRVAKGYRASKRGALMITVGADKERGAPFWDYEFEHHSRGTVNKLSQQDHPASDKCTTRLEQHVQHLYWFWCSSSVSLVFLPSFLHRVVSRPENFRSSNPLLIQALPVLFHQGRQTTVHRGLSSLMEKNRKCLNKERVTWSKIFRTGYYTMKEGRKKDQTHWWGTSESIQVLHMLLQPCRTLIACRMILLWEFVNSSSRMMLKFVVPEGRTALFISSYGDHKCPAFWSPVTFGNPCSLLYAKT